MSKPKLFQSPAQIEGLSTLKGGSIKITTYIDKELPGEEIAKLFDLEGKTGWFLFSPNSIKLEDIPIEDAKMEKNEKSPSQRLFNVMYAYFMQNHKDSSGFKEWRDKQMEKHIQLYKDKLM